MSYEPQLVSCRCCKGVVSSEAAACPHCGQPFPAQLMPTWQSKAQSLHAAGDIMGAIKIVREHSGLGLKESKELVDSWSHS